MSVSGWRLEPDERADLLKRFPPSWPDVIADHVTLDARAGDGDPLPDPEAAEVVGRVDDGAGLQALVVAIGGTTARPDGSTFHITWSIDRARGRKPVDSNAAIARHGWQPLAKPISINLIPARF